MRCSHPLLFTLVLAACPTVSLASETAPAPEEATAVTTVKIAVVDFSAADKEAGSRLAESLLDQLARYEGVQAVESDRVREAISQMKLPRTGPLDAHQVRRLGQETGAQRLVIGSGKVQEDQVTLSAALFDTGTGFAVGSGSESAAGRSEFLFCLTKRLAHRLFLRHSNAAPVAPGEGFSGLVLDARHLRVQRAMGPRILDEEGNVIYPVSPKHVPPMVDLQDNGMAAYTSDATAAPRSGGRPLMVHAIEAAGPMGDDLVVSKETAQQILQANAASGFLESWAVSIVMRAPDAPAPQLSLVRFKNGDLLTGTVLEVKEGCCCLMTEFGPLNVNQEKIERIEPKQD